MLKCSVLLCPQSAITLSSAFQQQLSETLEGRTQLITTKYFNSSYQAGDFVQVCPNFTQVKTLQRGHGEWTDAMISVSVPMKSSSKLALISARFSRRSETLAEYSSCILTATWKCSSVVRLECVLHNVGFRLRIESITLNVNGESGKKTSLDLCECPSIRVLPTTLAFDQGPLFCCVRIGVDLQSPVADESGPESSHFGQ